MIGRDDVALHGAIGSIKTLFTPRSKKLDALPMPQGCPSSSSMPPSGVLSPIHAQEFLGTSLVRSKEEKDDRKRKKAALLQETTHIFERSFEDPPDLIFGDMIEKRRISRSSLSGYR